MNVKSFAITLTMPLSAVHRSQPTIFRQRQVVAVVNGRSVKCSGYLVAAWVETRWLDNSDTDPQKSLNGRRTLGRRQSAGPDLLANRD